MIIASKSLALGLKTLHVSMVADNNMVLCDHPQPFSVNRLIRTITFGKHILHLILQMGLDIKQNIVGNTWFSTT